MRREWRLTFGPLLLFVAPQGARRTTMANGFYDHTDTEDGNIHAFPSTAFTAAGERGFDSEDGCEYVINNPDNHYSLHLFVHHDYNYYVAGINTEGGVSGT